ncbi:hypothetical protein [Yinghuangia seranimata]|uniref:hypothetical protein n=1 Tax=Yinghuangia seranimata TaxID=408067 RepID=UPI00248CCEC4|nr:hypothetical protein [Yinghuangia seranimata]MDI2131541.1 hypothetical protein [Yinghuangia seranimata]
MIFLVFICFAALALMTSIAAFTGYRGLVCHPRRGYPVVTRRISDDTHHAHEANRSVAHWCTGAALLSIAPLVPLGRLLGDGIEGQTLTTGSVVLLAAYGAALVVLGRYPFERIRRRYAVSGADPQA